MSQMYHEVKIPFGDKHVWCDPLGPTLSVCGVGINLIRKRIFDNYLSF